MALLRKAIEVGYHAVSDYRTDDALDSLRSRDDFRLLMRDLAMPADPFAPDMGARR
jgi:eukaryotic-like serine/threonine-protein kinase